MSRVFIINQPMRHDWATGTLTPFLDLSQADEFGELEFVLPDGELRGAPDDIVREIKKGLAGFNGADFLLLVGDPRAIAWGAAIAAERVKGRLTLLRWVRSEGCYAPITVDLFAPKVPQIAHDGPARVFVVNKPLKLSQDGTLRDSLDIRSAEEFGKLEEVLPDGELQGSPEEIVREIHEGLATFRKEDHLMPIGDPRAIAWSAAITAKRTGGHLPLLHWVRSAKRYQPIPVSLRGGKVPVI